MAGEPSPAPPPRPPAPSRGRRLGIVLGVWAVLLGGAVLAAAALDQPVGSGERDDAQPQAPGAVADADGLADGLPPLTLILDRPLPGGIADLPPIRQPARLEALAQRTGVARRYTELGSALQTIGDAEGATAAYRAALRAGGDELAAETGLALVQATGGGDGPARADDRLAALAAANPDSAIVAFNRGWLAVYRRDADLARESWARTIALDPGSRLARVSRALIASLEQGAGGRNP